MIKRENLYISQERSQVVRREIAEGSEPGIRFYIMVVISTMIAGFGLVTGSTAVIIGAMLVAPLMTPIFGMALALIRGDAKLLGRSGFAEFAGVVAAICMGYLLGVMYGDLEPTREMLIRTKPLLFDLLVAVFSGFAGAYALVDEKLSPALPGVAIATAIVPPLANTGLCLSVAAYAGALGSFLLFFSNFLSILLVASFVFWLFGLYEKYQKMNLVVLLKRFSLPMIGFVIIATFLTHTLLEIVHDRKVRTIIIEILSEEIANIPSAVYDKMVYQEEEEEVSIYAQMYSPISISPTQVSRIESVLSESLGKQVQLTVQSKIAQVISRADSSGQITKIDLNGEFIRKEPHSIVLKTKIADDAIRSHLANYLGTELLSTRILQVSDGKMVLIASLTGVFTPRPETIEVMESKLREVLNDNGLSLLIQFYKPNLLDKNGHLLPDLTGFVTLSPAQQEYVEIVESLLEKYFDETSVQSLINLDYTVIDEIFHFFIEVSGDEVNSSAEIQKLEILLTERTGKIAKIFLLTKFDTVISAHSEESYLDFSEKVFKKLDSRLKKDMKTILKISNL